METFPRPSSAPSAKSPPSRRPNFSISAVASMHRDSNAKLTRREWLSASALASGALLFGLDKLELPQAAASIQDDPFRGGRQLGVVPFIGERSEEHTSELQSLAYLVCRLLLEKKKKSAC